MLANANAALFRAKASGRGALCFFEAEMDDQLRERRALTQDLRTAIRAQRIGDSLPAAGAYQRRYCRFRSTGALESPTLDLLARMEFIPLAEESGLIVEIGEWILREACREAASWPKPLRIAVNLSAAQFRHGDLVGLVHTILLETGVAGDAAGNRNHGKHAGG